MSQTEAQYRLVKFSDSEDDDIERQMNSLWPAPASASADALSRRSDEAFVPDLNLRSTPSHAVEFASRQKRKVRLKRKQRDRFLGSSSTRDGPGVPGGAGSADDDECQCCGGGGVKAGSLSSGWLSVQWLAFLTSFFLVLLAFFTAQLHVRTSALTLQLESVVDERNQLQDKYNGVHVQLQEVLSNQSLIRTNNTLLAEKVNVLSRQVQSLDSSTSSLIQSLKATPELKNLPSDVEEMKKEVANFGARLKDLESTTKTKAQEEGRKKEEEEREEDNEEESVTVAVPQMRRMADGDEDSSRQTVLRSSRDNFDERLLLRQFLNGTQRLKRDVSAFKVRLQKVEQRLSQQEKQSQQEQVRSRQSLALLQSQVGNLTAALLLPTPPSLAAETHQEPRLDKQALSISRQHLSSLSNSSSLWPAMTAKKNSMSNEEQPRDNQ